MSKIIGYCRVSTSKQDLENQKQQILNYTNSKKLGNVDFIEATMSSKKKDEDRKIDELVKILNEDYILVVAELSRIGRSVINVVTIINELIAKKVNVHIIKEAMIVEPTNLNPFTTFQINIFSSFGQLERDMISQRTKHALAIKKQQGIQLGRKKGQMVKSKFDSYREKIEELYQLGLSCAKIVDYIGIGTQQSLNSYIKTRKIVRV